MILATVFRCCHHDGLCVAVACLEPVAACQTSPFCSACREPTQLLEPQQLRCTAAFARPVCSMSSSLPTARPFNKVVQQYLCGAAARTCTVYRVAASIPPACLHAYVAIRQYCFLMSCNWADLTCVPAALSYPPERVCSAPGTSSYGPWQMTSQTAAQPCSLASLGEASAE